MTASMSLPSVICDAKTSTYTPSQMKRSCWISSIDIWEGEDPDIVTGWNVKFFDMPYLYARMDRVIEKRAKKLSPWGIVRQRDIQTQSGDRIAFEFVGLTILDYFDLYQKFTYVNQESYKLDHIAFVELGEKKGRV